MIVIITEQKFSDYAVKTAILKKLHQHYVFNQDTNAKTTNFNMPDKDPSYLN